MSQPMTAGPVAEDRSVLPGAAFYCVSSSRYFLGAVALVNSLRLLGHTEPVYVLDYGLREAERELLTPQCTLVTAPEDTTPFLLKTVAPTRHPAEVMVLIDADMIVTQPLTEMIERAAQGRILAVEHGQDRFFENWGELLGLHRARRRTYVTSSLVIAGGEPGRRLVRLMHDAQPRIDIERTPYAVPDPDLASLGGSFEEVESADPFFYADQDVLNAILACEIAESEEEVLDRRVESVLPFIGLEVVDEKSLRCSYDDGVQPYAVHQILEKPWLRPMLPGVYTQLMIRLLAGTDVAVKVPRRKIPIYVRGNLGGRATRAAIQAAWRLRYGRQELGLLRTQTDRSAAL
jgi:hypothetical protein